jgi:hypothetical protein
MFNLFKKKMTLTSEGLKYIQMIGLRAKWIWEKQVGLEYPQEQAVKDLTTVHTVYSMKLKELFEADDAEFQFDIFLIQQAARKKDETGKVLFTMNVIPKFLADENLKKAAERQGIPQGISKPILKK